MKKFIILLTVSLMLLTVISEGYTLTTRRYRDSNGRAVRHYSFRFKEREYSQPPQNLEPYQYSAPRREQTYRPRGGGNGPNYYRNYHPDYPGLDFSRYDMMPYYHRDRMWLYNQRLRHRDCDHL